MSSFYDQIRSLNASSQKIVKSSPAEISALCQKSERYIQSMVTHVKSEILQKAKSGKISYVEKPADSFFMHRVSVKATKPHYRGGVSINYRIDIYTKSGFKVEGHVQTQ